MFVSLSYYYVYESKKITIIAVAFTGIIGNLITVMALLLTLIKKTYGSNE